MILISGKGYSEISSTAIPIMEKLERDNWIFSVVYHNNNLLIGPRHKKRVSRYLAGGAGLVCHLVDSDSKEFIEGIKQNVPRRGEFNWDKYIK